MNAAFRFCVRFRFGQSLWRAARKAWRWASLLVSVCLGLLLPPAAVQAAENTMPLPASVVRALKQAGIPDSAVSVLVQDVGATRPRLSLHADQARNPASVMKLLTTYVALDMLGPAYHWQTDILASQPPRAGVLQGDLVIKGGGDPKLGFEQFWLLLRQLRARGVREIRGDLLLDRSLFDVDQIAAAAAIPFDDQPLRPYNVIPDPLLLNYKVLRLQLLTHEAHQAGQAPDLVLEPRPDNLVVFNRLRTTQTGACGNWRARLHAEYLERGGFGRLDESAGQEAAGAPGASGMREHDLDPGNTATANPQLILSGEYPLNCGEQTLHLGAMSHAQYVHGVFRQLWLELGGSFSGQLALDKPLPAPLQVMASSRSPALAEVVRDINKYSNNVMTRQLFLTLGAEWLQRQNLAARSGQATALQQTLRPVSTRDATRAVRWWLAEHDLDFPELVLENGAGLSREERISARSLTALLQQAWHGSAMPEFIASLPLAGVDGTMKKRLRNAGNTGNVNNVDHVNNAAGNGQARIKTGTLNGVSSIAGYVRDRHGRWQTVVFMVNHANAFASRQAQDLLLSWLLQGGQLSGDE